MKTTLNENEWIRMILLLADVQGWLNELSVQAVERLHPPGKKLLTGKQYHLPLSALAHILERHYHVTMRHPGTGKFLIPVSDILDKLKEAAIVKSTPMSGTLLQQRLLECDYPVGINREGDTSWTIMVITDHSDAVVTAYPV
ncbi:MAG: hypothetical protein QM687_08350 [Ferruginibacter sp.]